MKTQTIPNFTLWLEFEIGDPDQPANRPYENFCNIAVMVADGRRYALNVWTFDFLPLARYEWPYKPDPAQTPARYLLPPDLFVERLDRPTIQHAIEDLLRQGYMKDEWLSPEDDDEPVA